MKLSFLSLAFAPVSLCLAAGASTQAAGGDNLAASAAAPVIIFQDQFQGKLGEGWVWLREHKEGWRISRQGLEVLIEPGNMWGPQNNARNVLLHSLPESRAGTIEVAVSVQNAPTNQYEQVDLVWYFDDSNMVKVGEELVDGQLSIVMGREEKDKTRTVSITPLDSTSVQLRMRVYDGKIHGSFKTPGAAEWKEVGICELPKSEKPGATPKISLQFYQGAPGMEHWARVTDFRIARAEPKR